MSLFFSFSIAGGFLPLILRYKGISTETSISTTYRNCQSLPFRLFIFASFSLEAEHASSLC
jgi:hypothetical protein